jgi:hypothetical protein
MHIGGLQLAESLSPALVPSAVGTIKHHRSGIGAPVRGAIVGDSDQPLSGASPMLGTPSSLAPNRHTICAMRM